ncbi:RNA polymerase sigma-70 factor (ECF subfamily) [Microbacterium endophyticum]|uniref:RNA polymerase sigma factor n=1 Tax=Microbacterium endophyticum TaxID=1526412 RepID=A0A7W4V0L2_9MICO|nr:RNA polymerase sigma factor [Microbacterium endophyticum]MBB2974661.1 RNA polymerase sigma-70 factor (ECF subfamily) [Microbacterium endophyticum]NIK36958.1 RNA polymerase sigma-70 factor (ECF subfamily) [Microbacterium endophyticum]
MPHTRASDADLIARATAGSDAAFRELYRAYGEAVYRIAFAITRQASDAEDVVQETFVTAWRKLRGFELESTSALPWLATICRFHAANRVRRQKREREHITSSESEKASLSIDVEQQIISADLADRIAREVRGLSDIDRQIFVLCVSEGYAYVAAAEALGVTHGVVRNRLSRIRTKLRTVVKETN